MEEKVFFKNSMGLELSGLLLTSSLDKETPIIVLTHGLFSNKNGHTFRHLPNLLKNNLISSFRFDFSGCGESEGLFEELTISKAKDDILSAINFLKKQGFKKIGLLGSSFGGLASILAASELDDLFVLILKSPVSDYEKKELQSKSSSGIKLWNQKGFWSFEKSHGFTRKLNYSFFEDSKLNKAYNVAKQITFPTLIIHGDADDVVSVEQSIQLSSLIKNSEFSIIKGGDHRFSNETDFELVLDLILSFILKHK